MSESTQFLTELMAVTKDGLAYYEQAAQRADNNNLKILFKRLAQVKSELASSLSNEIAVSARTKLGEWAIDTQATYRELGGKHRKPDAEHVIRLEEAENRLLQGLQRVAKDRTVSYLVRVVALQYVSKATPFHGQMRAMKRTTKAA
jgi:uncharacterized protein (TIGR02284 family)